MQYLDENGKPMEEATWRNRYLGFGDGYEVVEHPDPDAWRVCALQNQQQGSYELRIRVHKDNGGHAGMVAKYSWPNREEPDETHTTPLLDKGDYFEAKMVMDVKYFPDRIKPEEGSQGPYCVELAHMTSDAVIGCGLIPNTNYKTAIVWMAKEGGVMPGPKPWDRKFFMDGKPSTVADVMHALGNMEFHEAGRDPAHPRPNVAKITEVHVGHRPRDEDEVTIYFKVYNRADLLTTKHSVKVAVEGTAWLPEPNAGSQYPFTWRMPGDRYTAFDPHGGKYTIGFKRRLGDDQTINFDFDWATGLGICRGRPDPYINLIVWEMYTWAEFEGEEPPQELPGEIEIEGDPQVYSNMLALWVSCPGADSIHGEFDAGQEHREAVAEDDGMLSVTDLTPDTEYVIKLWGRNAEGDGPDHHMSLRTAEEGEPGEVPGEVVIDVIAVGPSSASVSISLEEGSPPADEIQWVLSAPDQQRSWLTPATATNQHLTLLVPETRYVLQVSARNEYGWGQMSSVGFTTTEEVEPADDLELVIAALVQEVGRLSQSIDGLAESHVSVADELVAISGHLETLAEMGDDE